eukprot:TRINITY_DN22704_c0_g1_i1.p1 TRINITY_DN22704_c0_g1~~TRINITY_DN22704_c0_g1_i1.p1  ORF type:complete len:638 (+),score=246.68 TRINITY_DN22704_c0_g1_i1:81-1994(+)
MANLELFKAWQSNRAALLTLDEELYLLGRWKRCSTGFTNLKLKGPFPAAAAMLVAQYLPIYHQDWMDSLVETVELLQAKEADICSFDEHEKVIERLDMVKASLREYDKRFGVFDDYLMALKVPPDTHLPEREMVRTLIRELKFWSNTARDRWLFVRRWTTFYQETTDKSCYELKKTLRLQLRKVMLEVHGFAEQWKKDSLCQRILSELHFLSDRQTMVDNLGDPKLTKRDVRKMFLPLNLPFDESVSEDYAQTITFRQAVTLGLSEATRLRGYIWDDRGESAEDPDAKTAKVLERILERKKRLHEEMERCNAEERALLDEAQRVYKAARSAVEHRMGSRLWTAGTREAPRVTHCWAGCELCASESIAWVAVPLNAASAQEPFVLCQSCMPEYEANRLIHQDYVWLWISHLLCGTLEDDPWRRSVYQMAEATLLPVPSTLKTRSLPSAPATLFNQLLLPQAAEQRHQWKKNDIRREYFKRQEERGFVSSGDEDEDAGVEPTPGLPSAKDTMSPKGLVRQKSHQKLARQRSRTRLLDLQKFDAEWEPNQAPVDGANQTASKKGMFTMAAATEHTSQLCRRVSSRRLLSTGMLNKDETEAASAGTAASVTSPPNPPSNLLSTTSHTLSVGSPPGLLLFPE